MSQADPTIGADKSGLEYRTEDNAGKTALLTHHKGSTAPAYAQAGTIWLDDAATPWILKLYDGADWISMGAVNATANSFAYNRGLAVAGSSDETQLKISGHSTQTNPMLVVEKSDGTDLFIVDQDGDVTSQKADANNILTVARTGTGASEIVVSAQNGACGIGSVSSIALNFQAGNVNRAQIGANGGLTIGSPTGGNKGDGTLNATAVYDDNTLLTCYVLQSYLDGQPDDAIWNATVPDGKTHEGYEKFKARIGTDYDPLDIDKYWQHAVDKGHLTSLPGRANWDREKAISTGALLQRLWETVEIQAVHIQKLHQRLKVLES